MDQPTGPAAGLRARFGAIDTTRRTVRGRVTSTAILIVAGALAIAFFVVILVFRSQLQAGLDQTLEQQVLDRARLLDRGSAPDSLTTVLQDETLVWIGTPAGEPLAVGGAIRAVGSPVPASLGGVTTMTLLVDEHGHGQRGDEGAAPAGEVDAAQEVGAAGKVGAAQEVGAAREVGAAQEASAGRETGAAQPGIEREEKRLRIASAATADGSLVVVAGADTEVVDDDVAALVRLFGWSLPALVLLVGAVTWSMAGRVLRPVEQMRAQAESISGARLDSRVPVPDTGDEINDLGETLNAMLDRLESHDRALRDFTADASHELKSPVANVRALLDTADGGAHEWPQLRRRLIAETDRLRDLVDNLLFLASREAGAPAGSTERVALDDLLFDEAELLAATGRVAVDLSDVEPAVVDGRRADLVRLVRNLVDNAARHAERHVSLGLAERAGQVVLSVSDDGPGVPRADRARIFDRFTRLDEARTRDAGGAGLGLAIVARIATDHGATVTVGESSAGGACFSVTFTGR